jgi:hypothetical protein
MADTTTAYYNLQWTPAVITNNNWIRYVDAQPAIPEVKQEYLATLVTDDDEDA